MFSNNYFKSQGYVATISNENICYIPIYAHIHTLIYIYVPALIKNKTCKFWNKLLKTFHTGHPTCPFTHEIITRHCPLLITSTLFSFLYCFKFISVLKIWFLLMYFYNVFYYHCTNNYTSIFLHNLCFKQHIPMSGHLVMKYQASSI